MATPRETMLVDVFVQRHCGTTDEVRDDEQSSRARLQPCLDLHGILREESYLARDGQRSLCHFRAPDAESLRMALRGAGIDFDALWTGAVRELAGAARVALVVERVFEHPLGPEQERACRAATARRLRELGAEPVRVLLSRSRKRLLWLCRTGSTAAVEAAGAELAKAGYEAWSCEALERD